MPDSRVRVAGRDLRRLFEAGAHGGLSDGELLERFVASRGPSAEACFVTLLDRHGDMVFRVCRGCLDDPEDARDAYQASFLVLVRRAGSIREPASVASWLYGVAARISIRVRTDRTRRETAERLRAQPSSVGRLDAPGIDADGLVVRDEIARLPDKYRSAVVLCDLEELTYDEAAQRLRLPVGTIKSRLCRARAMLKIRFVRRGIATQVSLAVALLGRGVRAEVVPWSWREVTIRLATVDGLASSCTSSIRASALAAWLLRATILTKLRAAAILFIFLGLAVTGVASLAQLDDPAPRRPAPNPAPVVSSASHDPDFDLAMRAIKESEDGERKADGLLRLATIQVQSGAAEKAKNTLRLALAAVATLGPDDWTLQNERTVETSRVHPHTLIRIAVALSRADDRGQARETIERPAQIALNGTNEAGRLDLLRGVVMASIAIGDRKFADKTYEQAKQVAAALTNERAKAGAPGDLARMQAALGDVAGALRTLAEAKTADDRSGWNSAVVPLIEIAKVAGELDRPSAPKDLEAILSAADQLTKSRGRAAVQGAVVGALGRRGDFAQAFHLASVMNEDLGNGLESLLMNSEKARAFQELGAAQAKAGDVAGARDSLAVSFGLINDTLARDPGQVDTLGIRSHIGISQAEAGDLEGALETARIMTRSSSRVFVLEAVAKQQDKTGDHDGARETLRLAIDAQKSFVAIDGGFLSLSLAWLYARSGRVDAALQTADAIKDDRWRGKAYESVARVQGECGAAKAVLEWVAKREPKAVQAQALQGLAEGLSLRKTNRAD
jgi:RNA polymerase sigma factor (sigma-70 family)